MFQHQNGIPLRVVCALSYMTAFLFSLHEMSHLHTFLSLKENHHRKKKDALVRELCICFNPELK